MDSARKNGWVTHALNDAEVAQALHLGGSLRHVKTKWSLIIIVDPNLSESSRVELEATFDFVFSLEGEKWSKLKEFLPSRSLTSVYSLGLTWLEKCILLPPNYSALSIPDKLFEEMEETKCDFGANDLVCLNALSDTTTEFLNRIWEVRKAGNENSGADKSNTEKSVSKSNPDSFQSQFFAKQATEEPSITPEPIAVIGMACRLPSANNIYEFWELLISRSDAISPVPAHRWTKEQHLELPSGISSIQAGFLSVPIDEMDAKFFELSPKQAISTDPQHRILMEVIWESLEDAGINPQELKGTHGGVFIGNWRNDYKEILQHDKSCSDIYTTYKGNCIGAGAGAISRILGWTGPCLGAETDCAAGLLSVNMALKSLRNKDCNIALACGVNLLVKPYTREDYAAFLSPDQRCKTFDESANGYVRAEGCGSLVLKRYSDAIKDGNRIWGLIRGTSTNQEGLTPSMGTPTVPRLVQIINLALQDGNIDPSQVSYVEAHGTGTAVGDVVEMNALSQAYAVPNRTEVLTVSTAKTNVGHGESASGITGIIKVLLSMWNEVIPPHNNFKTLNPRINLEKMRIPLEHTPWPRVPGKPRIAGVCSYGLAGKNSHCILQEAPVEPQAPSLNQKDRPLHILKLTAKSKQALDSLKEKYEVLFKLGSEQSEWDFADIAHTTNTCRASFPHRLFITAENSKSVCEILKSGKFSSKHLETQQAEENPAKICFLFTGQGSQYHGMAQQLYETSPVFQTHFDFCEDWLQSRYSLSIKQVFFSAASEEVHRTINSQVGIFIVEYCLTKLWQSWGIKPDYVLGHSLGEFAASVCAGILKIEDALTLVAERSLLIDQLPRGKMLVIKADKEEVDKFQREFFTAPQPRLDYAAFNSKDQTVVAGSPEPVLAFQIYLKKKGIKCTLLQSTHAFHSREMDPMLESYRKIAEKIHYRTPRVKYISGMLGKADPKVDANYWVQHTRDAVNFLGASEVVINQLECPIYIEIGPNPTLTAMILMNKRDSDQPLCLPSLRRNVDDWKVIFDSLGKLFLEGVEISWEGLDRGYNRKKVLNIIPTYPFQRTKFWPKLPIQNKISVSHPMLGSSLPNPTPTSVFQSSVSTQELPYLNDHKLGDSIIFPGAGYIEMMLAAGATSFLGMSDASHHSIPIQLKDFKIRAPLKLEEEDASFGGAICQTILHKEKECEEGFKAAIYQQKPKPDGFDWIHHASAQFIPNGNLEEKLMQNTQSNQNLINKLKTLPQESLLEPFYKRFGSVGLNLIGEFRTLQKIWRCRKTLQFLAEVTVPKDSENYLLHPILIDAMIQTAGFPHADEEFYKKAPRLNVSATCKRFIWLRRLKTETCFLYSPRPEAQSTYLFDSEGALVAVLLKAEIVETTVENILAMLETQTKPLPNFYSFEYREILGPNTNRIDFKSAPDGVIVMKNNPNIIPALTPEELQKRADINTISSLYILNAFLSLGWTPKQGEKINASTFIKKGVLSKHEGLLNRFFLFLEEDGILIKENNTWLVAIDELPSKSKLISDATHLVNKHCPQETPSGTPSPVQHVPILLLQHIGEILSRLLTGKEQALPFLFPEDPSNLSAARGYEAYFENITKAFHSLLEQNWAALKTSYSNKTLPTLRILEIGAGTGVASYHLMETLHQAGIPFEYVYTDISSAFFLTAEKKFEKFGKDNIKYVKFNAEEDPTSQGLPPHYFDLVVSFQVVHATRDIKETLLHLRQCMVDGGNLWLCEALTSDRLLDCTFGLLDGFWRFTDKNLRSDTCMLSANTWKEVTEEMGFTNFHYIQDDTFGLIICKADDFGTSKSSPRNLREQLETPVREFHFDLKNYPAWVVFYGEGEESWADEIEKGFEFLGRKRVILVKTSSLNGYSSYSLSSRQSISYEDIPKFCKELFKPDKAPQFEGIIVTWGLSRTETNQEKLAKPYLSLLQTLIKLPAGSIPQCYLLTEGQFPVGDVTSPNPASSTLIGMSMTALNEHKDLKLKVIDMDPANCNSSWEAMQQIFTGFDNDSPLISVNRGSQRFVPKLTTDKPSFSSLSLLSNTDRFQILVEDKNEFRFGPLEHYSLIGNEVEVKVICSAVSDYVTSQVVEFSGIITQLGRPTSKWQVGDEVFGLSTSSQIVPSHVKVNEASIQKLPSTCTFAEAACLPLDFITAYHSLIDLGKAKKGETVLIQEATEGLGLAAIQIARNSGLNVVCTGGNEMKQAYLKRTLGVEHVFSSKTDPEKILAAIGGIDIVLNSQTGQKLNKTSFGSNTRFVNPKMPLEEGKITELLCLLSESLENTSISPIPYTRFDIGDIHGALASLQNDSNIGKIISVSSSRSSNGKQSIPLFNSRSTYLITGGLGGIGVEVAKYMAEEGAAHIVLVGRNPPSAEASLKLKKLQTSYACNIVIMQGDIGKWKDCERIFFDIASSSLPLLRGVMHAAGTLSDGMMENINYSHFEKTFKSKVDGSWYLHNLTKSLPLEHFVLYSSVASKFCYLGQGSHVAGCYYQDSLAHFRRSQGLPATTIGWGQWGEVGVARNSAITCLLPFSLQQGINALDQILRKNKYFITAAKLDDSSRDYIKAHQYMKFITDPKIIKAPVDSSEASKPKLTSGAQFWTELDGCGPDLGKKSEVAKKYAEAMLREILRLDDNDPISKDTDLSIMGMDSLMMLELRNLMQTICKDRITIPQISTRDCKSLKVLSHRFVEMLEENSKQAPVPPTIEESRELARKDVILPEDILPECPGSEVAPSKINSLLLTGATGLLGAHMLKQVVECCPQLGKIYCLVRGDNPTKRLLSKLEKERIILTDTEFAKVIVISGDFAKNEFLGLSSEEYAKLSQEIEGILHLGTIVSYSEYYTDASSGIRSVNVKGLLNILKFACKTRTKHVFYSSTIGVTLEAGEDGRYPETFLDVEKSLSKIDTNLGYPISKLVNELQLKSAVAKGIPCKILRYTQLRGSTSTGKSSAGGNFFMKLALFFLQQGVVPDDAFPFIGIPIDLAHKLVTRLVFNDTAPNEVYNLTHPKPTRMIDTFPEIARELGYSVAPVKFEEFLQGAMQKWEEGKGQDIDKLQKGIKYEIQELLFKDKDLSRFLIQYLNFAYEGQQQREDYWVSRKLSKYVPELYDTIAPASEIFKKDLHTAIKEGYLD